LIIVILCNYKNKNIKSNKNKRNKKWWGRVLNEKPLERVKVE